MDTSGFKGWWPMRFFEGKGPGGQMQGQEGFRNVLTGQEFKPESGWDGEPPCPTGDLGCARHASLGGTPEFWQAMAAAKETSLGEVIYQKDGRTVIRY